MKCLRQSQNGSDSVYDQHHYTNIHAVVCNLEGLSFKYLGCSFSWLLQVLEAKIFTAPTNLQRTVQGGTVQGCVRLGPFFLSQHIDFALFEPVS